MQTVTVKALYPFGQLDYCVFKKIAQDIAAILGDEWELSLPRETQNYIYIRNDKGMGFSFYLPSQVDSRRAEAKILVQGLWDTFPPAVQKLILPEAKNKKLTLNPSLGLPVIISTLKERFLDDYIAVFELACERYSKITEANQKLVRTAQSLASILNAPLKEDATGIRYEPRFTAKLKHTPTPEASVSGEVTKNGVNIQINNLPPDVAQNLMFILNERAFYRTAS